MALPPAPRRRRRWPWVLLLLTVLLLAAIALAPALIASTSLKDSLIRSATADLKGQLTVAELSWGWFQPVQLRGVELRDDAGDLVLSADQIDVDRTLWDLVSSRSDLGTIRVAKPVGTIICTRTSTNLEQVIETYLTSPSDPDKPRTAMSITWAEGQITLKDDVSKGTQSLSSLEGTVTIPSSRSEALTLEARGHIGSGSNPGSIHVTGSSGGNGSWTIRTDRLPLVTLGWTLQRFETGLTYDGLLSGSLTITPRDRQTTFDSQLTATSMSLSTAESGLLKSDSLTLPAKLSWNGKVLAVDSCDLTCDAGRIQFAGTIDPAESPERWLNVPGLTVHVALDASKLARTVPILAKRLDGTTIHEGKIEAQLTSRTSEAAVVWSGSFGSTTLRATRQGRAVEWKTPIKAEFAGRRAADGLPEFEKLQVASDFIGLNFRGSWDRFEAAANLDLDRLAGHLADFADLGELRLAGRAAIEAWNRPTEGGAMGLAARGTVDRFQLRFGPQLDWQEPRLTVDANASIRRDPAGPIRLDRGTATLASGGDTMRLEVTEPVPDLRSLQAGKGRIAVAGDLSRWRNRLAGVAGLPTTWQVAGNLQAQSAVGFQDRRIVLEGLDAGFTNLRFRGAGVAIDDPQARITIDRMNYDTGNGSLALTSGVIGSETLAARVPSLRSRSNVNGLPEINGTITVTAARLNRLAPALGLSSDPRGSDALDGLAKGTIELSASEGATTYQADLTIDQFRYGPPRQPTWTEPWVKLNSRGQWRNDTVQLTAVTLERDGLRAEGQGELARLSTVMDLNVSGKLTYDLARFEPQIRSYLGKGGAVTGRGTRPFQLQGRLSEGAEGLTMNVPNRPDSLQLAGLRGSASAGWQTLKAFGFDVGAADVNARIEKGVVAMDPIDATFGQGRLRAQPSLKLNPGAYDLSFARGRIIERARLTPAACADALGFALPAVANSTDAEGLISFEIEENRIPLADINRMALKGNLTLHRVTLTPGPVIREILTAVGTDNTTFTLANEQQVAVWVENGRVHHRNLKLSATNFALTTSGSVGLDGTMALTAELPIPAKLLDQVLKNQPRIRDALAKKTVSVAIGGTLNRPQIDARAMQATMSKLIQDALKDATKGAAEDFLKKGLDQGLDKLLPKPKKP